MAGGVGATGVSGAAVPTTLLSMDSKSTSIMDPLNQGMEKVKSITSETVNGMDSGLKSEYSSFGNKVKENYQEAHTKNMEELSSGLEAAEKAKEYIRDNGEDINYYAFQFGHLAREAMKNLPLIVRDSFLEMTMDGSDKQLLNFQKIADIVGSEKLNDFMEGVGKAMKQHPKLFSELTTEDAKGIMQILRETPRQDVDRFLGEVKTNSEKLDKDSNSYCNATKLMLHLLVGKDNVEGVDTKITELVSKLTTMETELKKILGEEVDLNALKTKLNSLSGNSRIKDPCATTPATS